MRAEHMRLQQNSLRTLGLDMTLREQSNISTRQVRTLSYDMRTAKLLICLQKRSIY